MTMRLIALLITVLIRVSVHAVGSDTSQTNAALRIVVVEGEDAVNIIQQKTAVAPVVEVRDRNDQPVAGAIVNFAIRSGRATFGGARTLSVTTNAAGRAIAAGFAPTGSGALQISATAAFQGQTAAAVTIAQTTVQTAAQAAAVGSAGGAGGSSGGASAGAGAGAGGGGGLSGTTIGILGAAAAGGVVAAKELGGHSGGGGTKYTGQFSGTLPMTFPRGTLCTRNEAHTGTLEIELTENNGAISGTAHLEATVTITPGTCDPTLQPNNGTDGFSNGSAPLSGTAGNLTFNETVSNNFPASGGFPAGINSYSFSFVGALNGAEISGTLTVHREIGAAPGAPGNGTGTVVDNVTLR